MHKVSLETVRLFDNSRKNIVDCVKMAETVDDLYSIEDI